MLVFLILSFFATPGLVCSSSSTAGEPTDFFFWHGTTNHVPYIHLSYGVHVMPSLHPSIPSRGGWRSVGGFVNKLEVFVQSEGYLWLATKLGDDLHQLPMFLFY